ncbi:MAG: hypothetical protein REI12_00765 [Pedobacter sp.]|nr:hypothetical protein [Pedobacter sp.]
MEFKLKKQFIGSTNEIPLSQQEFLDLIDAQSGIIHILSAEEKYDLLLRNFIYFEKSAYEVAINELTFRELSWSDFIDKMQYINLHLINLLSTCRTYVDHIPQHISYMFGTKSPEHEEFIAQTRIEYDSTLGYRTLYALRNYVQHNGLPIHAMALGGKWNDERTECTHSVTPYLSIEALEKDGQFKPAILDELKALGDRVDVRMLVLQNMSSFGRLHEKVRSIIERKMPIYERNLSAAKDRYVSQFGENITGLTAFKFDENGNVLAKQSIFDDATKRRAYLEKKNPCRKNVEKHFISGKASLEE